MSLAPAVQGATLPALDITWLLDDSTPLNLTGATLTGSIYDGTSSRALAGTLTLVTPASGIFRWQYAAGDVAEPGMFVVQFTATFGGGAARTIATSWQVHPVV